MNWLATISSISLAKKNSSWKLDKKELGHLDQVAVSSIEKKQESA